MKTAFKNTQTQRSADFLDYTQGILYSMYLDTSVTMIDSFANGRLPTATSKRLPWPEQFQTTRSQRLAFRDNECGTTEW